MGIEGSTRNAIPAAARLIARTLDSSFTITPPTTSAMARLAFQSRTQFHRWFRSATEETPQAMRRRLLLERAAWHLHHTDARVTDIAIDAGYGSLEAFTRSFARVYGVSPSHFRRIGTGRIELAAPNGIHFHKPGLKKGQQTMTLYERFAGAEAWHTRQLLDYASALSGEQLDRPLSGATEAVPFQESGQTLRTLLENIIYTKEVWAGAMLGWKDGEIGPRPLDERTPARMKERLCKADSNFDEALARIAADGRWDDEFVDALCEPPETFSYGGVFTHIITFNAHRRLQAMDALRQLGIAPKGYGDPVEYERASTSPATK
ncbi:MAG TPA: DinB family protein [Bryobacteraceae bacterium]|nr:DinB family protein [Bryobacteraceae bacterium]